MLSPKLLVKILYFFRIKWAIQYLNHGMKMNTRWLIKNEIRND